MISLIPAVVFYLLPIVIVAAGGLVLMLADAVQDREGGLGVPTAMVHAAGCAVALGLWKYAGDPLQVAQATRVLGGYMAFDRQALFLDAVICLGGMLASLVADGYLGEHRIERGEFYSLLTFATAGCMMLSGANDLIMVFIGLETLSLGVYTMTGFRRTSGRSSEAALKYFLLGSFAAALLLYGSALLYGFTGHTDFPGIRAALFTPAQVPVTAGVATQFAQSLYQTRIVILAMVLVLVSLAFKISAVPFHMWTPDAYEGAPTPGTAYMAVAVKSAAFGALLRVMLGIFGDPETFASPTGGWPHILAFLAVATMTVGNLIALAQTSVKRMLAYSSIAHAGYLLIGVVIAPETTVLTGSTLTAGHGAIAAVLFYLLAYTVSNVGAFGSLVLAGRRGRESVTYDDLAGLGKRHPVAGLVFAFFILSLVGVPPTVGFFAKFYVIRAALESGHTWLALFAMINSAIAAYYYLRVLVAMYMTEPATGAPRAEPMSSPYVTGALVIAAALVLYFGVRPNDFLQYALDAVRVSTPS